ncbi:MAG TPA: PQQ-dependent sugar dehydrogenase [Allosphingosinicella sp.]
MPKLRLAFLAFLSAAACNGGGEAVAGGDGAASVSSGARPFAVEELARFDEPWAIAFLPDGRALVTEKAGRLKLWRRGGAAADVAGAPAVAYSDQGGLLDVALAPDFAASRAVYLSYAEPGEGGSGLALARGRLVEEAGGARLDGLTVLWRQLPKGNGGQFGAIIAFSPDGRFLFLSSGERQRFTPAQDPNQAVGKILRLTLDGKPAPGNPGAGRTGAASVTVTDPPRDTEAAKAVRGRQAALSGPNLTPAETWTSGHRNPYGLAFAPDGRLWEHEMGPRGGDEFNLIEAGRNYGWPIVSNGDNYDGVPIPDHPTRPEFQAPVLWWNPSISPAGLTFYDGRLFPQWKGSAFLGALSGQALIRIAVDGATARKADQWDMGARIREVAEGPDGALYLLEDGSGGRLLRLTPAR